MLERNPQLLLLSTATAVFIYNQTKSVVKLSATFTLLHFCLLASMYEEVCNALSGKERGILARNSDRAQIQGCRLIAYVLLNSWLVGRRYKNQVLTTLASVKLQL